MIVKIFLVETLRSMAMHLEEVEKFAHLLEAVKFPVIIFPASEVAYVQHHRLDVGAGEIVVAVVVVVVVTAALRVGVRVGVSLAFASFFLVV